MQIVLAIDAPRVSSGYGLNNLVGLEDVVPHRGQTHVGTPRHRGRVFHLFVKPNDAARRIDLHHTANRWPLRAVRG